jgi:hypothetical protein
MSQPEHHDKELGSQLHRRRPVPRRRYTMALRYRLLAADAAARRPKRLWLLVCVYLASGTLLLVLALLGALGSGPFGS